MSDICGAFERDNEKAKLVRRIDTLEHQMDMAMAMAMDLAMTDKPYVPRTPSKEDDGVYGQVVAMHIFRYTRQEIVDRLNIPEARVKAILDLYRARRSAKL